LNSSLCEICNFHKWEDVHHQNYDSMDYDNPWNELDQHLLYLCKDCHDNIHKLATWKHSTKQEDMDKWLSLLEEINKSNIIIYEENRLKELQEDIRKKELYEKIKKENESNEKINIFFIVYFLMYIYVFNNYISPYFGWFDIAIFLIGWVIWLYLSMPLAFVIGYFRNK